MDYIKDRLKEPSTWLGLVSVLAAIIMAFTPDNIDRIIETIVPKIKQIIEIVFAVLGAIGAYKMVTPDKSGK